MLLAAENLKNTIPSSPVVGRVERESCFCSRRNPQKYDSRPSGRWDGLSGNRVFGDFSYPKSQKYDSLLGLSGNRVFSVFRCPKPQKCDCRPFGRGTLSGNRVFGVFGCPKKYIQFPPLLSVFLVSLAARNLKNTIPSSPVVGRVERESCFWWF